VLKQIKDWQTVNNQHALDGFYTIPFFFGLDVAGPYGSNFHVWMKKVRQAFDPNDAYHSML
jgi:hypothetical protein